MIVAAAIISPAWHLHPTARPKRDKIALRERLRRGLPLLRRATAWYLRWRLSAFLDEGWTAADVLHALVVLADDSRWTYTWRSSEEIRHVPGWVAPPAAPAGPNAAYRTVQAEMERRRQEEAAADAAMLEAWRARRSR
ncbi:hypothetical protein [Nonomuraea diastatica]|uniref:Uncharacterized protein n=1 Tax=Nonomuraea diastatica TaxID=1848329 RepID=A0A4R4W076_9ACTN|nr:hypothetical protein [Nonomuraea diastatica]TDD06250.1 hypothetical protein E1294_49015 [Nonomuraea diastatica]